MDVFVRTALLKCVIVRRWRNKMGIKIVGRDPKQGRKESAKEMADTEYRSSVLKLLNPMDTKEFKLSSRKEQDKIVQKLSKKLEARDELAETRRQEVRKALGMKKNKGGYVKKYANGGSVRKVRS